MGHCAFGLPTENWSRLGTITADASVSGLGPGQLQNDQGATSASWTTPAGVVNATLDIDAGAALEWNAVALCNTNLTTSAIWRLRLGASVGSGADYDTGDVSAGVVAGYRQAVHVLPSTVTARYLRITIADTTNPETLLRVAQCFAGRLRRPIRNFGFESTFVRTAEAPAQSTRGGQEFPEFYFSRRAWALSLPSLHPSDVWPLVQEMQRATEAGANLLFIPFPEGADLAREAVFGRLVGASGLAYPSRTPVMRAWGCTVTERL